ncbi:MAG TPA: hypothetical protein VIL20_29965 [Sandaracinaceae bacterium]
MPLRTQAKIRRDINRLDALITEHAPVHPPLAAIQPEVSAAAENVNSKWRAYQNAAITLSRELKERDTAVAAVLKWARSWRGVVLIKIPGAESNIHEIPANGATADDVLRHASDIQALIETRPEAESFREQALAELGTQLDDAKRETKEATLALPAKETAREAYGTSTIEANTVLVRASEIVRNIFGPKSREYKQFIGRATPKEEEQDDHDSDVGEDDDLDTEVGGDGENEK